jgi:hypothetical protein
MPCKIRPRRWPGPKVLRKAGWSRPLGAGSRSTASSSADPLVKSILERLKPRPGPSGSES